MVSVIITSYDEEDVDDMMMLSLHLFRFEDNGRVFCEGENDVLEFYKEEPLRADTRLQVKAKHKTKTKDKEKDNYKVEPLGRVKDKDKYKEEKVLVNSRITKRHDQMLLFHV